MNKPLVLIDGSSYLFRAFHALPPLVSSKGQPTGAIYGVTNMIRRILKDETPTHLAVIFDAKGKTFRDEWFPAYKAHRPPTPIDLSSQFDLLIEGLTAMGIPLLIVPGVEADDVIGTLAKQAAEAGQSVLISTGDKDMAQLVNEHITLINTMTGQRLDRSSVKEKFGVYPEQIIDYLALIGDTSDNVPGIAKCGPKTAVKWLTTYQNIESLLQNANEIPGKIGITLRESVAQLLLSQRLVTLKTDVELDVKHSDLLLKPQDEERFQAWARELEFKNWLTSPITITKPQEPESTAICITELNELTPCIQNLASAKTLYITMLTETDDPMDLNILSIGIAIDNLPTYFIQVSATLPLSSILTALQPALESTNILKISYDFKRIYTQLKTNNIHLQNIADLLLESYLLNSGNLRHDLDAIIMRTFPDAILHNPVGSGAKKRLYSSLSLNEACLYVTQKIHWIKTLHNKFSLDLPLSLKKVLQTIEIPLVPVLAAMEYHGVLIDSQLLHEQGLRLGQKLHELNQEATDLAGHAFNLNSPKQLQTILYEELVLPILAKTPTGQPSTAEAVLQTLAEQYRLPAVILEYRSLSKLVSTYIDALPKRMNPLSMRVHTSYNQAVTATGRLSSSEPNLQNIPIRSEEGRLIRRAFIAPKNHILIAADYSQIELRIMAHLSSDPALLKAFANQLDIHQATASEIFNTPLEMVTAEQRRRAKAVNFGLIYGMSAFGLAKQLGVERHEAQQYIDIYFHRYPGVLAYMERTRTQARTQGYVETIFGRRLYLPEINDRNALRRQAAERMAINAPMQGSAADIIKQAMIALFEWQQHETRVCMIMQVHDELVFEVQSEAIEEAKTMIRHYMENTIKLSVPLTVSIGVGLNWDEAH